jgi:hypothetical protein
VVSKRRVLFLSALLLSFAGLVPASAPFVVLEVMEYSPGYNKIDNKCNRGAAWT